MDFAGYLEQVREQTDALRAAASAAGPDADVPTCPGWTVRRLVGHIARVQARTTLAVTGGGAAPEAPRPPSDWDELTRWWAAATDRMIDALLAAGPDGPAWTFLPAGVVPASWWARRQAHEAAVHRLDAEGAGGRPVPTLLFDGAFAADGIDELLGLLVAAGRPTGADGRVLVHAADVGRAWLVEVENGAPTRVGPVDGAAVNTDASVVGTADAVYRAVWGRPSGAVVRGDVSAIRSP